MSHFEYTPGAIGLIHRLRETGTRERLSEIHDRAERIAAQDGRARVTVEDVRSAILVAGEEFIDGPVGSGDSDSLSRV